MHLNKTGNKERKTKKEKQKGIIEGNLRKQVNEVTWCSPTGSEEHHKGSFFGDKNGESGICERILAKQNGEEMRENSGSQNRWGCVFLRVCKHVPNCARKPR